MRTDGEGLLLMYDQILYVHALGTTVPCLSYRILTNANTPSFPASRTLMVWRVENFSLVRTDLDLGSESLISLEKGANHLGIS